MLRKLSAVLLGLAVVALPAVASAHVIVTPGQVGIGQELTFNVSVPNERDTPVTNLKLEIPAGVSEVIPTSKDGWTITTDSTGSGDDAVYTDIVWSAGTIPVGQRQDFSFSAQAPAKAAELDWKAYQTYGDGTVVHWDQKPAGSDDATGNAGPYSVTKVVNDLTSTTATAATTAPAAKSNNTLSILLSVAALIVAIGSFTVKRKA